ncbi:MAG: hypothetical protein AAFQ54_04355 [Pseudomonadota bacterium]
MTRHRLLPSLVGLGMGLMLPFALHGTGGLGAVLFALAHVAVLGGLLALPLLIPRLRRRLHRPSPAHLVPMGLAAAAGFTVICLACPRVFGMAHPWI